MGTYHVIDGHKVTVRYPGQQQTCARCHETSQHCPGRGVAKKCEAAGGTKVELTDYILKLWAKVGYTPKGDTFSDDVHEGLEKEVVQEQEGGSFTPVKVNSDPELFKGVCIKTFQKETDHALIMEFLIRSGLDEKHKDDVSFKSNGSVIIKNLENSECKHLISAIHNNEQFGKKLFCNGFIPLTPEKGTEHPSSSGLTAAGSSSSPSPSGAPSSNPNECQSVSADSNDSACPPATCSSGCPTPSSGTCSPVPTDPAVTANSASVLTTMTVTGSLGNSSLTVTELEPSKASPTISPNQSLVNLGAASVISELDTSLGLLPDFELVRRHSLSMRDIPPDSLAAEILNPRVRNKSLLNNIRDISRKVSDFESCQSSLSSARSDSEGSTTEHSEIQGFKTMNNKKRSYRQKRKASLTPKKEDFIKKQNKSRSPQGPVPTQ